MGKIYAKFIYDNSMGLRMPPSINISHAVMGFKDMGAEVVPYEKVEDIYDIIEKEDIVLDYLLQCGYVFRKFGVVPELEDYPEILQKFLGRKIWKDTINNIATDVSKWGAGNFVKKVIELLNLVVTEQ